MSDKEKKHTEQEVSEEHTAEQTAEKDEKKEKPKTEHKKSEQEKSEETINDLGTKLAETNEKYLRLYSEFDNYRKRTAKERIELSRNASEDMIVNLLPVLDDFERALKAIDADEANNGIREGLELIYSKLLNTLAQKGLKAMESNGNTFDAEIHEAIAQIPSEDENSKGKVIEEVQKGYYLYDKVIRYAKVVVAN